LFAQHLFRLLDDCRSVIALKRHNDVLIAAALDPSQQRYAGEGHGPDPSSARCRAMAGGEGTSAYTNSI